MNRVIYLIPILFFLLLQSCSQPVKKEIPYSFLDHLNFPFTDSGVFNPDSARVFTALRKSGKPFDLILPDGGTEQATWLFQKDYSPNIDNDTANIIAHKRAFHGQQMIYNLDTLPDGKYVMGTTGDGYGGFFCIEIKTEK
jgi:hypothetical protein